MSPDTSAMTDAELADAQTRHDAYKRSHDHPGAFACCTAHASADDVPGLLAEVERLRKENAELRRLAATYNAQARAAHDLLESHTPGPRLHGLRRPNGHITPGDADWCLRRAVTGEGDLVEAETCVYQGQWRAVGPEAPVCECPHDPMPDGQLVPDGVVAAGCPVHDAEKETDHG